MVEHECRAGAGGMRRLVDLVTEEVDGSRIDLWKKRGGGGMEEGKGLVGGGGVRGVGEERKRRGGVPFAACMDQANGCGDRLTLSAVRWRPEASHALTAMSVLFPVGGKKSSATNSLQDKWSMWFLHHQSHLP